MGGWVEVMLVRKGFNACRFYAWKALNEHLRIFRLHICYGSGFLLYM